jgi:large conductance mechanosensitive channel
VGQGRWDLPQCAAQGGGVGAALRCSALPEDHPMSMLKEFKEFAVKGNVVDMAVGIIIGAAFTPIVNSLVNDVIMPPIGLLLGGVDFSQMQLVLQKADEATQTAEVAIRYGKTINVAITFLITAFAVFMLVKAMNKLRGGAPAK